MTPPLIIIFNDIYIITMLLCILIYVGHNFTTRTLNFHLNINLSFSVRLMIRIRADVGILFTVMSHDSCVFYWDTLLVGHVWNVFDHFVY